MSGVPKSSKLAKSKYQNAKNHLLGLRERVREALCVQFFNLCHVRKQPNTSVWKLLKGIKHQIDEA